LFFFCRTYVTFERLTRSIGQASKAMEVTHAKNTISNFKRLIGRRFHDSHVQQEKQLNSYSIIEGNNGSVNIEVKRNVFFVVVFFLSIIFVVSGRLSWRT